MKSTVATQTMSPLLMSSPLRLSSVSPSISSAPSARPLAFLASEREVRDVDARLSEYASDLAYDSGAVVVLEDEQLARRHEVDQ